MDFIGLLEDAAPFGVALLGIVVAAVNALKLKYNWQGEQARLYAILVASFFGFVYLLAAAPVVWEFPGFLLPVGARLLSAVAWAFLGPLGYDLLRNTSASGAQEQSDMTEELAVMGGLAMSQRDAVDAGLIEKREF